MIATTDWSGIISVVVGCVLAAGLTLIGYLLKDQLDQLRQQLDRLREQLSKASDELEAELGEGQRQVRGVLGPLWKLMWRTDSLEDFLKDRHGYTPPRDNPDWHFKDF